MMALRNFGDKKPTIGLGVYVDESAIVIGDVRLHDGVSIWPGAVLRADDDRVEVRDGSAVMDMAFAEAPKGKPVAVGRNSLISHSALLHGCSVGDRTLVGIGSMVLDEASVGNDCIIAAGALVPPGMVIRPGLMVLGSPAKVVREVTGNEKAWLAKELVVLGEKASTYSRRQ